MNTEDINTIFWKLESGKEILLTELEEEHFKKAFLVTQKRQLRAYSTLEMCVKLEDAMKKIAKIRKIELTTLENSDKTQLMKDRWAEFKDIIERINRSIKLRLNKNAKAGKAILQEANS